MSDNNKSASKTGALSGNVTPKASELMVDAMARAVSTPAESAQRESVKKDASQEVSKKSDFDSEVSVIVLCS